MNRALVLTALSCLCLLACEGHAGPTLDPVTSDATAAAPDALSLASPSAPGHLGATPTDGHAALSAAVAERTTSRHRLAVSIGAAAGARTTPEHRLQAVP